jgi:hypothetical protein
MIFKLLALFVGYSIGFFIGVLVFLGIKTLINKIRNQSKSTKEPTFYDDIQNLFLVVTGSGNEVIEKDKFLYGIQIKTTEQIGINGDTEYSYFRKDEPLPFCIPEPIIISKDGKQVDFLMKIDLLTPKKHGYAGVRKSLTNELVDKLKVISNNYDISFTIKPFTIE